MIYGIFKTVLMLSAIGGAFGLVLSVLRPITEKNFSPKWQYYIWLAILLVMILPISFGSSEKVFHPRVPQLRADFEVIEMQSTSNVPLAEQPQNTAAKRTPTGQSVLRILCGIWLFGAAAIAAVKLIRYFIFLKAMRAESERISSPDIVPKRIEVRKTGALDAPLIVGLIKPVLYLPEIELSAQSMDYVLKHELTHYRRGDLFYKWFAAAVGIVHWFNPIIYIILRELDESCELSCDAEVTKNLNQDERRDYISVILDMLEGAQCRNVPLTTQMTGGKQSMKRRIIMIKTRKRTKKAVTMLSTAAAAVIFAAAVFADTLAGVVLSNSNPALSIGGKEQEAVSGIHVLNRELYIPLRAFLESTSPETEIEWVGDGTIILRSSFEKEDGTRVLSSAQFAIRESACTITAGDKKKEFMLELIPDLKDDKTYIPLELALYLDREIMLTDGFEITASGRADSGEVLKNALTWANALKTRDGKPRYDMMTESMQKEFEKNQKALTGDSDMNYTIGFSSPRVVSYDILVSENSAYITYIMADNTDEHYSSTEKITFEKTGDKLLVTSALEDYKPELVCAYLRAMDGNTVTLDFAEYITDSDAARMAELNLTDADMPSGYYIYNPDTETKTYTLTNDTIYDFVDWSRYYTDDSDIKYVTNKREEFKKYVDSYENSQPGMPFFFEFDGDKVVSIVEYPMA